MTGSVAFNRQTGEVLVLSPQGEWAPATRARNPQTGVELFYDGSAWQPMPGGPERSLGEQAAGVAGQFGAGFNQALARTVGAPFDLVNRGLRAVGVPIPQGSVADTLQRGMTAVLGEAPAPQGTAERLAHGAGSGLVDAAALYVPAVGIARAGQAGAAIPGMVTGIAGSMATQPALQAGLGALGGAVSEATDNPLLGAAAAVGAPVAVNAARAVVTPVTNQLSPQRAALVAAAQREGIPLTAGQITGNRFLQNVESQLEQLPLTSGPQRAIGEEQRRLFTQAAARRAGSGVDNLGPDGLTTVRTPIVRVFDDLSHRNTMDMSTPAAAARLAAVRADLLRDFTDQQAGPALRRLDEMIAAAQASGGVLPGTLFRRMDSELGRRIRETGDADLAASLGRVRDAFRSIMDDSISPADAAAWQQARRDFANYAVLRDAMAGAGEAAATGQLPPLALRQALSRSVGRDGYAEGRGDLNELARVGQAVVRPPPDSGTGGRTYANQILTGSLVGAGGTAGAVAAGPMGVVPGAVATLALPRLAQMLMNTPWVQGWLTNQALPGAAYSRQLVGALAAQQGLAALNGADVAPQAPGAR
jgi:hypothetical protein